MAETYQFVEGSALKIYNAIVGRLMDEVGEPLYPGDERRIFGDAVAAVMVAMNNEYNDKMNQRNLPGARGTVLDDIGMRYRVVRAQPASAFATFRFTLAAPLAENVIIPAGTRITTDGSVYFATDTIVVLQAGAMYVDVTGTSLEGGSAYNGYGVGTISTLVDLIPYVASVENITVSTGGDDGEPYTEEGDNRFRERIHLAPATLSTAGPESGYRYWALSADPDIIDVAIDNPDANIINIYPLMRGGALPDAETLAKVLAATSAADRRPMTDLVSAIAPEQVSYDISLKYYTTPDGEADAIKAIEADGGAIDQYNEWQTSALDRDINPDQLRKLILAVADRVDITAPVFTAIGKSQVPVFSGKLTVTHEVVT